MKRQGRECLLGDLQLLYRSFATFAEDTVLGERWGGRGEGGGGGGGGGGGIEDDSMRARYFLAIVQITSGPGSRIPKFGLRSGKSCLYLSARRPGKHFVGEGCPLA